LATGAVQVCGRFSTGLGFAPGDDVPESGLR